MSIKINGFLKDVGGASRVTKAREEALKAASPIPQPKDAIRELTEKLHPLEMRFKCVQIREASPTAKTFRFESVDGHIPVFQSGQYVNFRLKIGASELTRPYTIASAPFEARGDKPFFEVTIRRNAPYLVPDWLFENLHVGDEIDGSMPFGTFYFEPLRDTKNLVALAGGSGITPFYSMAKEIAFGKLKGQCRLTILYGSVKSDDIVLKDELDAVCAACEDIKVVHVLSDDPAWEGEHGFITKEIIEKYSEPNTTYLFCGPLAMYDFVSGELDKLGVPFRRVRMEVFGAPRDVYKAEGYPADFEPRTLSLTVRRGLDEQVIPAASTEPLAVAMERAGIKNRTRCRSGACGYCRCYVTEGEFFVPAVGDGRRFSDKQYGYVHACSTYPLTDMVIEVPII